MKKQLLTRMLLAAALLGLGSGAWADAGDVIYSNDFSTKDQTDFATWTATGKKPSGYSYAQIGRGGTFSIATGALVNTSESSKKNGNVYTANVGIFKDAIKTTTAATNYVLSFDITLSILDHANASSIFEISDEDKQVLVCLYATHTRSNSTTGSTSYGYIVGGNNGFQVKEASSTSSANAEGTFGDGTKHEIENVSELTGDKTYHVVFDAKVAGKATLTITEGENTVVDAAEFDIAAGKGMKYMYFANHNYGSNTSPVVVTQHTSSVLDNFSIVEGAASSNTADYTVKYVATINDVETEIKESVVRNGFKGETVTLEAADMNSIMYNDVKYIYSSDNASATTIADDGSSVVKVQFTVAPTYTYTVTDNFGNELASGSAWHGDDVNYYIPYYVFVDGRFYGSPSLSSGSLSFAQGTISNITANTEITVTYTEEANTNVVFFSEAENLEGASTVNDNYTKIRMSNGKAGYFTTPTAFINLPAGEYTITSSTRSGTTNFYKGEVGDGTKVYSVSSSGSVSTTTSEPFTLTEATDIVCERNKDSYFDYVIIRKTAGAATITSAGWATLYTPHALDFSGIEGLTAYTATCSDNRVTLTQVTDVPANTGVVLKGEASTYFFPVIATSETDKGNLLGSATDATAYDAYDGYTLYMLNKVNGKAQFVSVTSGEIAAGKAFLKVKDGDSSLARNLDVVFADETTGINDASPKLSTLNSEFSTAYDLQGRKVNNPKPGLYIVNGKKLLVK